LKLTNLRLNLSDGLLDGLLDLLLWLEHGKELSIIQKKEKRKKREKAVTIDDVELMS